MWSRIYSCFRRHRRKLFIIGGVIGGFALLNAYLRQKLAEWEKNKFMDYIEQMKKQNHFEVAMQTCDSTLISIVPEIRKIVINRIDVNPIVEELKKKPANKIELWDELKIMVFTQMITEAYAQCLLAVLLKVQVSIISGFICATAPGNNSSGLDERMTNNRLENQQKYLMHVISHFINCVKDLIIPVEDVVRDSLKEINLQKLMKFSDFQGIFSKTMQSISHQGFSILPDISHPMLPEYQSCSTSENTYDDFFIEILNETKDVLECDDFDKVLSCSVDHGVNALMDRVSECFRYIGNGHDEFKNPHDVTVPLAKLIPIIHSVYSNHQPNEQGSLAYMLLQQEPLKLFAANLYEAFSQKLN